MTEFKQFHDERQVFFNESQVYFSQADCRYRMSFSELMKRTSDAAVEDYRQRGLSWEVLAEHNTAILVSRLSFRFHRMPLANERITVKTWEEEPDPLQLMRAYEIFSENGEPLISGFSSWVIVNLKIRRIMRTKNFTLRQAPKIKTEHDCLPLGKIFVPEQRREFGPRTIRYSDIDGNGHINNARYAEYILDSLPNEYQTKNFSDFRINFSKEAVLGDRLMISGNIDDEAKKIIVAGTHPSGAYCFESELWWK